ncbi:MOSC domain-containing protein [Cohnella endophytica]|uniref:MOSC domain-containing protein n=1 Tax=Cohnella endophytica TaxID=2419778 RepID=A0A494Y4D0_9BACL|nr:MOSC domain-containing protein [Cohnella endophytica]RKP56890.1 MOSC domain-containing protein [Cohnella endophytica]
MEQLTVESVFPVLSVNVGKVWTGTYKGKEAASGITKKPVEHSICVTELGLAGDEQADLVHHGGPDKAICVYIYDHYAHWERMLNHSLPYGAFGENLTVSGMSERDIHIGDIFRIGSVVAQVSQPRQPCWKLAMKWGLDELPLLVTETGATGFYFRVLEPGKIEIGDDLQLAQVHSARLTVDEANRVMHKDKTDEEGIRRLLDVAELSASWVKTLTSRLNRLQEK